MSRKRFFFGAVLAIVVGAMVTVGTISAADGQDAREQGSPFGDLFGRNDIVGTWEATVSRGPLPSLKSLHSFSSDHTMIEFGSDTLFRSPGFGVWRYIGNRTYATTMVMHRFSPAGEHIGSLTVNCEPARLPGRGVLRRRRRQRRARPERQRRRRRSRHGRRQADARGADSGSAVALDS